MRQKRLLRTTVEILAIMGVMLVVGTNAWAASKYKVLYSFTGGADGNEFMWVTGAGNWFSSGLVADQTGTFYGTTAAGGDYGYGVVFKLAPGSGGSWTETVLYRFTGGADGAYPFAGLVFDTAGNLYGTTSGGGSGSCSNSYTNGCGVVFELTPNLDGSWTENVIYSFTGGADGAQPEARLTFDASGNLYGTANAGGQHLSSPCPYNPFGGQYDNGCGVVFELIPNGNGTWAESVLHRFTGGWDGGPEVSSLTFDAAGNLYGTAQGGKYAQGVVFKLAPSSTGWKETALHTFTCQKDGCSPLAFTGLAFDATGSLYGTTFWLPNFGGGTVYKLTPTATGPWKWSLVHSFGTANAYHPVAGVILDADGNVYGTATSGGAHGSGEVFKVMPTTGGGWKYTVLHTFANNPLSCPFSLMGAGGTLYGSACYSDKAAGGVFEITP